MRMTLFVLTGLTLLGFFLLARWLVQQQVRPRAAGHPRCRDPGHVQGYNPLAYKLTIWTISAMMCGVAGALYVPQVGIINPAR
jgi:urea transport system permease protein